MDGDYDAPPKMDEEAAHRAMLQDSCNLSIDRKEALVAKEAKFERRAQFLTRHFLQEFEQKENQKKDELRQASQMSWDKSRQRVYNGQASAHMLKEMVREEKNQISMLMSMKAQQREDEEMRQKEREDERKYMREARTLHEKMHLAERERDMEERSLQRKEELGEKLKSHSARAKERMELKSQDMAAVAQKFDEQAAKVREARRQQEIQRRREAHLKWSTHAEKEQVAKDLRDRDAEERRFAAEEKEAARRRRVDAWRELEDLQALELAKRICNKGANRSQQSSRCESRNQSRGPHEMKPSAKKEETEESDLKENSLQKVEGARKERHERAFYEVQKDYVERSLKVDEKRQKMHVDKQFKYLAEGAAEMEDDLRGARLKAVFEGKVAQKSKEPRHEESISSRDERRLTVRSSKGIKCGLCERVFPPEDLAGRARKNHVDKLRRQNPKLPKTSKSAREKYSTNDSSDSRMSKQPTTPRGGLYEAEVKLCPNCDVFTRISSA